MRRAIQSIRYGPKNIGVKQKGKARSMSFHLPSNRSSKVVMRLMAAVSRVMASRVMAQKSVSTDSPAGTVR